MNKKIKEPSQKRKTLAILGLVFITVIVFWNGMLGDFVWDDIFLIVENPQIYQDDPLVFFKGQFFPEFKWNNPAYYRPLVMLSYWSNYQLFGLSPSAFHAFNLSIHLLCILLLIYLLRKHFKVFSFGAVWLAAAVFALHPYHVESITFISGRTDLLATAFFLFALLLYMDSRESGRAFPMYLSVVAFLLGLLSKELIVVLIPAIIIWELLREKRPKLQEIAISVLPFLAATFFYFPLRSVVLEGAARSIDAASIIHGFGPRLFYAPVIFSKYLVMLMLPGHFNAFRYEQFRRHFTGEIQFNIGTIGGIALAIAFALLFVYLVYKKRRALAFWLSVIPVGLVIVLYLIPFPVAPISERFLYLPSLGLAVVIAAVVAEISDKIKAKNPRTSLFAMVSIILLTYYSALVFIRNFDWHNDLVLYSSILKAEPESALAHTGMAKLYGEFGEHDSVIYHATAAIKSDYTVFPAWLSLANAYIFSEQYDKAEHALSNANALAPRSVHVYNAYGNLESRRNNSEKAKRYYLAAISIHPEYYHANYNLGRLAYLDGNHTEALSYLERARRSNPKNPQIHRFLSIVYSEMGENEKAREAWAEYLRLPGVKVGDFVGEEDAPGVIPESMRQR